MLTQVVDASGVRVFEDEDEAARVAPNGSTIIAEAYEVDVDWNEERRIAMWWLDTTIGHCDTAAVLEIPGAAETVAAMRRLHDEIGARRRAE